MPLQPVSRDLILSWSIHDSWSETFVGVRRLVYELLPAPGERLAPEDAVLCQLALVGSTHLMELALYKLLKPYTVSSDCGVSSLTAALLEDASYHQMLTRWLPAASGKRVDLQAQPFKSTEALRRQRNAVVHKESTLATVQMARSALYSAVEGCRALFRHAGRAFPYEGFISSSKLPTEAWFSDLPLPPSD